MKRKGIITLIATLLFITTTISTIPAFASPTEVTEQTIEEVVQNIEEYDNEIEANMEKLNTYKDLISEKEKDIEENQKELAEAKATTEEKDKQLADRLKLIQSNGGVESTPMMYVDALLSSGNIMDAINKINLISKICTSDKDLVEEAKNAEDNINKIGQNIENENEELKKNKEDIEKQIEDLEKKKSDLLEYVKENNDLLKNSTGIMVPVTLPSDISDKAKDIIEESEKYLGVPYLWGGETPQGFDCSGLLQYVFNLKGIDIPRTSQEQQKFATKISMDEIKPGDLVFNKESDSTHVGMYIGNDMYIQAPHTGDFVKISKLSTSNMQYVGRVLN